jgi:hypothetical protein
VKRTWNTCSSSFRSLGGFIRVYSFRLYSGIIKAAHPPVSWLPFPSLLFSSLPALPPPLSNKPPHFLPRIYTQTHTTTLSLFPSLSLSRFSESAMIWLPVQNAIVAHQFWRDGEIGGTGLLIRAGVGEAYAEGVNY